MLNQELVELIHAEVERLKRYVSTLPPDALQRPTPCEGWNVGDILTHFVWAWSPKTYGGTYSDMIERGLQGDTSPPQGFPMPGTLSGPEVEALYGQSALTLRQKLGDNVVPVFVHTCDYLNDLLHRIGPEDWDKRCYHTNGLRSVQSFLPTIVMEYAVHGWDIRTSLHEPSPALSEASIPVLIEKHAQNRARPWRVPFPRRVIASGPLRYRFDLTGIGATRRDILVEGDQARMEPPSATPAHVYVRGDTGSFVLLLYGRLFLNSLLAVGSFEAEGDLELVPAFDRWLEGY